MATLDRPTVEYRTPLDLVRDIQRGILRIPPFQRGFGWEAADVVSLFDSIYRGFPVGNLILWRGTAPAQHLMVGPVDVDAPQTDVALWVVDGQQRIISLVGALLAADEATDPRFRIYLDLNDGMFRSVGGRQEPPPHWIPVNLLLDITVLMRWMRENAEALTESQIEIADLAARVIREYQIPTYIVNTGNGNIPVEIFMRINATGKQLSKAEVFHALHSGVAGDEPTDLRAIGRVPAELGFGALDDRLVLRCLLAFRGSDIFREDLYDGFSSNAERIAAFRDAAALLRYVVVFLQGEADIPHSKLLPYSHVLPILVRFMRIHGLPDKRVATLLRRWIWRSAVVAAQAKGISVVDIRHQVLAVEDSAPLNGARNLLDLVPASAHLDVDLTKVHLNHAMTRINVLGFLSAGPRDLRTREPLDVRSILATTTSPLRPIITPSSSSYSKTMTNRVISSPEAARFLHDALAYAPTDVAESHLIDGETQALLRDDRYEDFWMRRSHAAESVIQMHVDRMAEWGARDGRAIADVIRSVA